MAQRVLVTDHAWELDIEREILAAAGAELIVAPPGGEQALAAASAATDAILTNWRPVPAAVLEAATSCLAVVRYGVGLDNIDVAAASRLGIVVANVPGFCADEVAEHALALMLALQRRVVRFADQTRSGGWDHLAFGPMRRVRGQVLGIVGLGRIGRAVAERAAGLGMTVLGLARPEGSGPAPPGVALASLADLLARSDVLTLHVPLTDATRGLIGAAELAAMKPGALLVNTSRGAVVDGGALVDALRRGHLGGAALDVLAREPPAPSDPLLALDQVIVTPHAAAFSIESTLELQRRAAASVVAVLGGVRPAHVVNPEVLRSPALRATALSAA